MDSLLNNQGLQDVQELEISTSEESLLNKVINENDPDFTGEHLSVYDQPEITKPSEHPVYEGGIPPCEIQAQIVFENYVKNSNRLLSGKEKRRLYRECLRNAKKGRYVSMFDPEKIQKRQERMHKNFEMINNPQ